MLDMNPSTEITINDVRLKVVESIQIGFTGKRRGKTAGNEGETRS